MIDGLPQQIELTDALRRRARHYRIGPAGRAVDDPSYQYDVVAFEGIGLRPLRPVHLRAVRDTSGDVALRWIRRTRIDGDRWDTPEVPLGEESEQYLLRILREGAIVREELLSAPSWTYPTTAQATDGATGAFEVQVAQVSAKFGPGVFARTDVPA